MPSTSVIPLLIDALVELSKTVLGDPVSVSDSRSTYPGPGDYLSIGVDAPENVVQTSATSAQIWPWAGHSRRQEDGVIWCTARAWTGLSGAGEGDGPSAPKVARDRVYAMVAALETALRSNPTISDVIGSDGWTSIATQSRLKQAEDANGASATVTFTVAFTARI